MGWNDSDFSGMNANAATSSPDNLRPMVIDRQFSVPSPDIYATGLALGTIQGVKRLVFGSGTSILTSPSYGTVSCVETADGAGVWVYNSPSDDYAMLMSIGDVDNDGVNEIAVGFRLQDHMGALLDEDGKLIWSYDMGAGVYCRAAEIGELRSDYAGKEIVFAGTNGTMAMCDKDGNEIWKVQLTDPNYSTVQSVAIGDADGDGQAEIYVACGGSIRQHRASDGAEVWRTVIGGNNNYCYGVKVGKVTTDDGLQIVGASEYGGVFCMDSDGNILWEEPGGKGEEYTVALGDADGDGFDEVFVGSGQTGTRGEVRWLSSSGRRRSVLEIPDTTKAMIYDKDAGELYVSCDDGNVYVATIG